MTAVSRRYLPALAVCLVLACAAVWIATLSARRWDRCADPAALADLSAVAGTARTADPRKMTKDGIFLWTHGALEPGPTGESSCRLVRSDRPALLLTNWVSTIQVPMDPDDITRLELDVDGESVPIQVARAHARGVTQVAVSLAIYDRSPVTSILGRQIATAAQQLVHGTLPLTLYTVDGFAHPGEEEQIEGPAREWLAAAWRRYREVCTP